jgi:hypothetical protein
LSPRFSYFYLMRNGPDRVRAAVSPTRCLLAGPWVAGLPRWPLRRPDRGLITFEAETDKQAQHAVSTDPFLREGLLQGHWLKQWTSE